MTAVGYKRNDGKCLDTDQGIRCVFTVTITSGPAVLISLDAFRNSKSNKMLPAHFVAGQLPHLYLNANVSQLSLKCYFLLFEPKILLHDIMINKSNDLPSKQHKNQTSETYDCRSSTRNVRQPKFEKSQSYNTSHFIESQCYTTLHFIRKRCLIVICFQNQNGRHNPSRLFYAFGNVHYVNVKPSIFDVICRLSTTEYK